MTGQLYISPRQAFVANATGISFDGTTAGQVVVSWITAPGVLRTQVAFRTSGQDHWEQTIDTPGTALTFNYAFEPGIDYEFKFVSFDNEGRQTYPDFLTYVVPSGEPVPEVDQITRPVPSIVVIKMKPDTNNTYLVAYGNVLEGIDEYELAWFTGDTIELPGLDPGLTYRFVINKIYKREFLPVEQFIEI